MCVIRSQVIQMLEALCFDLYLSSLFQHIFREHIYIWQWLWEAVCESYKENAQIEHRVIKSLIVMEFRISLETKPRACMLRTPYIGLLEVEILNLNASGTVS